MIRYDAIRALNPNDEFPRTPFNLRIKAIEYHLPIPSTVCDVLADRLHNSGSFCRNFHLCTPFGMNAIRANPAILDTKGDSPAYAGCETVEDITEPRLTMGYVCWQASINQAGANKFMHLAIEDDTFDKEASEWIINRIPFIGNCGGFELIRMNFYTSAEEKNNVNCFIDGVSVSKEPKSIVEKAGHKLRFRDMANALPPVLPTSDPVNKTELNS
jgi:hypothetical protein